MENTNRAYFELQLHKVMQCVAKGNIDTIDAVNVVMDYLLPSPIYRLHDTVIVDSVLSLEGFSIGTEVEIVFIHPRLSLNSKVNYTCKNKESVLVVISESNLIK